MENILKWSRKSDGRVWIGFIWSMAETGSGLFENENEPSIFVQGEEVLTS
jgi:hypothetical protein